MRKDDWCVQNLTKLKLKFYSFFRCLSIGGEGVLDEWLIAQENLFFCVLQNFDTNKIQREVQEKMKTGDLNVVFKKYCRLVKYTLILVTFLNLYPNWILWVKFGNLPLLKEKFCVLNFAEFGQFSPIFQASF